MDLNINFEPSLEDQLSSLQAKEQEVNATVAKLYDQIRELERTRVSIKNEKAKVGQEIAQKRYREAEQRKLDELKAQEKAQQQAIQDTINEIKELTSDFPTITKLHEYQLEDVVSTIQAYRAGKRGMLNANDMGMGKTVESVVILFVLQKLMELELGRKPNTIWLTKKSLMEKSTPKEIKRWYPDFQVVPAKGKNLLEREFILELYDFTKADIFVANYEFVRTTPKALEYDWDIVVIDEVHKLKGGANASGQTMVFKTCKELCDKARFILMLSGTPMVNAPEEMWSYLHIFNPEKFPTLKQFKKDFMEYKNAANGILSDVLEVNPNKIMQMALKGQMIRRSAEEVGLQLPPFNYEIRELEMNEQQAVVYEQMRKRFFVWLEEMGDRRLTAMAVIAQLTRLRQINLWPVFKYEIKDDFGQPTGQFEEFNVPDSSKIDETMDIIEEVQQQIVIGATFNEPLFEIKRRCSAKGIRCEVIYGGAKENDFESEFQQGRIQVLCINTAMGEGLNLQKNPKEWPGGASYGILLDRWWSPLRNDQLIKRIYRQGSNIPVFWYELQNENSVDQYIQAMNEDKAASFETIMSHNDIRPASEWKSMLKGLFE